MSEVEKHADEVRATYAEVVKEAKACADLEESLAARRKAWRDAKEAYSYALERLEAAASGRPPGYPEDSPDAVMINREFGLS